MIYLLMKPIAKMILLCTFKIEMVGKERMPTGAVIIAANHISSYDPIILSGTFSRKIHFLAKNELFSNHFSNWFLRKLHAVPVDRSSGIVIRPVRHVIKIIRRGDIFGIFPEGKRCKIGENVKPKKGVAFFGSKTGAPILPVAIVRKGKGRYRTSIKIIIGEPIDPSRFSDFDYDDLSQFVMTRIKELGEQHSTIQMIGGTSEHAH
ncbi:1-acyl-sn-glycerol-3-phosphate acyltransferase [Geomicrobium halophilum]|uniref:1-acyl-sn-glycerol-3-phosphate acyltransferase n=1 Tax=Geomicrobium halophilum TaxID=549000 RepID=A0A841PJR0_9BACL|nr:lysophospholipid acyltransferase family protein [Geomicrobium halophilum]MBB6449107.1 1-acyl-sn-glycerol-3-phosphate acyltransferase [Geomicrobium halophilum]